jgi:cation diffusion facilitator CzcD-associated flavoprotein CzcO
LGGVWAEENCYEGLKTNNLHGTYEFTDFPMDDKYNVREGQHIPGAVLHKYFNDFADHFDLRKRIKFNTQVLTVEKLDKGWKVTTVCEKAQSVIYECDKLIIGSGLASSPNPVRIPGQEDFGKPIFNHSRLQDLGYQMAYDPDVKSVTVVGASKTGYDAVHLMASHGKKVNWVIRESGGGGVWMAHPWVKMGRLGDFRLEHLATMRFFCWLSPCIWGDADGFGYIRSALHKTRLGRYIVHNFWENMRNDIVETNGYRKESVLEHLEPQER